MSRKEIIMQQEEVSGAEKCWNKYRNKRRGNKKEHPLHDGEGALEA